MNSSLYMDDMTLNIDGIQRYKLVKLLENVVEQDKELPSWGQNKEFEEVLNILKGELN